MSKKRKRKSSSSTHPAKITVSGTEANVGKLPENFNPDYTYVKKDLQKIGILAGIFITILVVLSFFI
jgi:hypothetical protein